MRNSTVVGRVAALAALVIAIIAIGIILTNGGSGYQVRVIFQNASQLVSGNQVEVSGNAVGSVSKIALTPNGLAELTLTITDANFKPLRMGTRAMVRQFSQSGVANRYVDLDVGPSNAAAIPNNGVIPADNTTSTVDLDQLFDSLNAETRQGLRDVFQGSASQYAGRGQQANLGWQYLNPSIATASVLFHELNRDTAKFTKFITSSSNLVTDLAARQADLSGLISNASVVFRSLANQQVALGQSLQQLPGFMRLSNTTFVNVRNALPDITQLINASRPVAPKLQQLLIQLRPLAIDAVPTVRDLSNIISRPSPNGRPCSVSNPGGCSNLIDLNNLAVPLAAVTVGNVRTNTAPNQVIACQHPSNATTSTCRPGAFTVSAQSFKGSADKPGATQELAIGRPYAPDLTGWFEGYSHPGLYDANGAMSRVAGTVGVGTLENGVLNFFGTPLNNLLTNPAFGPGRNGFANALITTGQGDRCPGSMERGPTPGSSAMPPLESGFPCNPQQVPTGP